MRMQWISVKDKLPSHGQDILVYYPQSIFYIDCVKVRNYSYEKVLEGAMYWCPLPAFPYEGMIR